MSSQPVQHPVNPLRRRMLEGMAMRGLHQETQRVDLRFFSGFARFLGRIPATADDNLAHGIRTPPAPTNDSARNCRLTETASAVPGLS